MKPAPTKIAKKIAWEARIGLRVEVLTMSRRLSGTKFAPYGAERIKEEQ
jgi:hypothetical protein